MLPGSEPTVGNAADEIADLASAMPSGRSMMVGIYATVRGALSQRTLSALLDLEPR